MRTTLTLDPDVEQMLRLEAHRRRKPFKVVVNEAIREGLRGRRRERPGRYRVTPHVTLLRPGIDAASFNQIADELEDEAVLAKAGARR